MEEDETKDEEDDVEEEKAKEEERENEDVVEMILFALTSPSPGTSPSSALSD